jgi:hypothetical protein
MKGVLISITVIAAISAISAFGQDKPEVGIKVGANYSILNHAIPNSNHAFIPGINAGIFVRVAKADKFHIRPELYFSTQGQKNNYYDSNGSSNGATTFKFYAVNLPILFEYGKKFVVQAGPQVGAIVYGKESGTVSGITIDNDLKDTMKPMDFGVVGGLAWYPNERFNVGVRYNFSVTAVLDREIHSAHPAAICNRVLQAFVGYRVKY